ncbi:Dabb family protein [Burkholderia paludis]|uniref:Dabb family protein n=1 Tax=Burkholderia paludis TaxID=1506587 RepID=UPI0005B9639F|nr:Dabb family protein [Burkholderia paludis]
MDASLTLAEADRQPAAERLGDELRQIGVRAFTAAGYRVGTVRHLVLLRFAERVPESLQREAVEAFLALRDSCVRDGRPYILSIEHGLQGSGEGADRGFEHAFLLSFASEGDRNYYVGEPVVDDPAFYDLQHHAFKADIGPLLDPQHVLVFDYTLAGAPGGHA